MDICTLQFITILESASRKFWKARKLWEVLELFVKFYRESKILRDSSGPDPGLAQLLLQDVYIFIDIHSYSLQTWPRYS